MAFITGLFLIDAPASALNNLGLRKGEADKNKSGVKFISTLQGQYPYVSAQAFRYWLRETLESNHQLKMSPIERAKDIAYTAADPINYWDDDLFGYMRAPARPKPARNKQTDSSLTASVTDTETDTSEKTLTRVSPFRVSTLVSVAPVRITNDFGVMARHEGHPVPHEHQFYRATLKGLFSLDLYAAGTFSYATKTGYRNLGTRGIEDANSTGLEHIEDKKSYRLNISERLQRVTALLDGLSRLEGGAKQTIHYTDVAPPLVILAVTRGGNHLFGHIIGANELDQAVIKIHALAEVLDINRDDILSPVYVGWVQGYLDAERARFEAWLAETKQDNVVVAHPRRAYEKLIADLRANPDWLA